MPLNAYHEGSANSEKITPQADMGNIYFQKIQISGPATNFVLEKWREYWPPFRKSSGSLAVFTAILRASSLVSNGPSDGWASNAAPEDQSSGSRDMLQAIIRPLRPARRLGHWCRRRLLLIPITNSSRELLGAVIAPRQHDRKQDERTNDRSQDNDLTDRHRGSPSKAPSRKP